MFLLGNTLGDLNGEERGPHVGKNFVRKVMGRIFSLQQTPSTGIIFGRTNIFNTFFLYLTTYIFITSIEVLRHVYFPTATCVVIFKE